MQTSTNTHTTVDASAHSHTRTHLRQVSLQLHVPLLQRAQLWLPGLPVPSLRVQLLLKHTHTVQKLVLLLTPQAQLHTTNAGNAQHTESGETVEHSHELRDGGTNAEQGPNRQKLHGQEKQTKYTRDTMLSEYEWKGKTNIM